MCSYHAWTFDADGMPLGKGERQGFVGTREERERLCLTRYRVDTCGRFVFVSRDPEGSSLEQFLGPFEKLLCELSGYIGTQTYFGGVAHAANWKLLVENVLECYHCSTVHPQTFVAGLGVGRERITDVEIAETTNGMHSSSHFPRTPIRREALRRKIVSHLDGRAFAHDSFFHVHIFPNLFISSTEGTNFYVGHAIPRAADTTHLRIRFFEPAVELSGGGRARQDVINAQSVPLGLQVIEEDRAILETVQRGVTISHRSPALGDEEVRIKAFHDGYLRFMAGNAQDGVSRHRTSEVA
jgi:phenylpropionate dioxygenase-like ring-hydroxylating dioxygenase large terminal subunit